MIKFAYNQNEKFNNVDIFILIEFVIKEIGKHGRKSTCHWT